MSIAITAPQKYAFQDLVCVEVMLRFHASNSTTLLVEPDGGEDAELAFIRSGQPVCCEIQVKGAGGAVTLADVAACLAHAPPRAAGPTLFERLVADPNRMALLVMSGRADDASTVYLGGSAWQGEQHAASRIKAADAKAFIDAFAIAEVGGSAGGPLETERQAHNAAFARSAASAAVRKALRRVIVLDQVDDRLEARCAERLKSDHHVPSDRVTLVLLELCAAVSEAKSKRTDALPLLRRILARASPPTIRPADYVARGDETELIDALSRDNVLLLSGTPRVGKTHAARWIAAEFMPLGYDVQEFADVEAADRFLLEPGMAPRLALIDDPLGGPQGAAQATRSLARLARLIGRTRPQRKLLATQGLEPLLETSRTASLDMTVTAHRRWRDMGNLEPTFLVRLWRSLASTFPVEGSLCERVADALATGELALEPGCLEHLAASTGRLQPSASIEDVARLGREDAAQLGRMLAADGLEGLAVSLAVTTAPREPISLTHLAYVRGSGGEGLPGKRTALGLATSAGDASSLPVTAPSYDEPPELATADEAGIDVLERRRLVTVDAQSEIIFAHPFYRAAAETLLDAPTHHAAQAIGNALRRGLSCLSPQTSRATARNLGWIIDRLGARPDQRNDLVIQAIEGLGSLYPATRDLCFRFLLDRLPDLPVEQQRRLPEWISSVTSVTLDVLEWSNGEARLPYDDHLGTDFYDRIFRTVARPDVEAELILLGTPESLVSPERAVAVLRFLADDPDVMTLMMVGRLLSYDEAALRAEATKLWLSRARTDDHDVLDRIFADDHPSCALAALKGVMRGWRACPPDSRTRRLAGLTALAGSAAAAAAMLDLLVLFNRVEHAGEQPPWPIFERLMPIVMATLPHNAIVIDARLFAVARDAIEALPASSIVALCDGWVEWLERNERAGRLPSEYSLGVADILLRATAAEPERRVARVARLLAFTGTGAKVTFMADLIDNWELLLPDERMAITARLMSGRSDDHWLQAVALTRPKVPDAIVSSLLPVGANLSQPPAQLVEAMPPMLMEAAIRVYAGRPQPLWWLGTHHGGRAVWEPIMHAVARLPNHPLFELAWDHVAFTGDGEKVARIVTDLGAANAERELDIMLRLKVGCAGNFMPEAWAALLGLATDPDEHGRWLDRMSAASPVILDGVSDLRLWLSEERDIHGMLDRLRSDVQPLAITKTIFERSEDADTEEVQGKVIRALLLLVRERPPRLFKTCDLLIRRLEAAKVDAAELVGALRDRRAAILAERDTLRSGVNQAAPTLDGWIDP